jgi:hypothetical protein
MTTGQKMRNQDANLTYSYSIKAVSDSYMSIAYSRTECFQTQASKEHHKGEPAIELRSTVIRRMIRDGTLLLG